MAFAVQTGRTPGWVAQAILRREVWLTRVAVGELAKWADVRSWGAPARRRLDRAPYLADQPSST